MAAKNLEGYEVKEEHRPRRKHHHIAQELREMRLGEHSEEQVRRLMPWAQTRALGISLKNNPKAARDPKWRRNRGRGNSDASAVEEALAA